LTPPKSNILLEKEGFVDLSAGDGDASSPRRKGGYMDKIKLACPLCRSDIAEMVLGEVAAQGLQHQIVCRGLNVACPTFGATLWVECSLEPLRFGAVQPQGVVVEMPRQKLDLDYLLHRDPKPERQTES